jgi:hypothetical protein
MLLNHESQGHGARCCHSCLSSSLLVTRELLS